MIVVRLEERCAALYSTTLLSSSSSRRFRPFARRGQGQRWKNGHLVLLAKSVGGLEKARSSIGALLVVLGLVDGAFWGTRVRVASISLSQKQSGLTITPLSAYSSSVSSCTRLSDVDGKRLLISTLFTNSRNPNLFQ